MFWIHFQIFLFSKKKGAPLLKAIAHQLQNVSADLRPSDLVDFARATADLIDATQENEEENENEPKTISPEVLQLRMEAIPQIFHTIAASFLIKCQSASGLGFRV